MIFQRRQKTKVSKNNVMLFQKNSIKYLQFQLELTINSKIKIQIKNKQKINHNIPNIYVILIWIPHKQTSLPEPKHQKKF